MLWLAGGKQGRFNILPLMLQPRPDAAPQMYEIPASYIVEIPLIHPTHHWFAELGLKVGHPSIVSWCPP